MGSGLNRNCILEGTSFRLVQNPRRAVSESGTLSSMACTSRQQRGRTVADMSKLSWVDTREEFSVQSGSNAERDY